MDSPEQNVVRWTPARLFTADVTADADRVRCQVCPFRCRLEPGQVGACRVRRGGPAGTMQTATFGSAVHHFDAVERKPFYHVRPGGSVLTLASPGCSFRCDYCINHRVSQYGRDERLPWTARPVDPAVIVAEAAERGADVALSYTEPSLAIELTLALADAGRSAGVSVLWKSNGFLTPEATAEAAGAVRAVNIDVKAADDDTHRELTGAPLAPVVEALGAFVDAGVWVEVSTPLVPGVSASPEQLTRIADMIANVSPDIPWHLLRWTPGFRRTGGDPTSPQALAAAVELAVGRGLRFVYVERALGAGGRSTLCPGCGDVLIRRGIWSLEAMSLHAGRCPGCERPIPGRW
jgi:pyruvate formate lyase activating enzyme